MVTRKQLNELNNVQVLLLAPAEHLAGLYRINGVLNNNQYKTVMRCINNEMLLSCSLYDEPKEME